VAIGVGTRAIEFDFAASRQARDCRSNAVVHILLSVDLLRIDVG
jgi:hypothetical protein